MKSDNAKHHAQFPEAAGGRSLSSILILASLVTAFLIRLLLLEFPNLIDPTEGRYAFVAQQMVISGDWITPMVPEETGIRPYLGKPPLHFWLMAISIKIFGMEEWCARLPSFLALVAIALMTYWLSSTILKSRSAKLQPLLLISTVLGFFSAGIVIVDVTFTAFLFLASVSYLLSRFRSSRLLFFAFVLGTVGAFMTKGPVALVLLLPPIVLTEIFAGKTLARKTIVFAAALTLVFIVPWFVMSELRNPGFIEYYVWNEHILRYLKSGYGDRYGVGHRYTRGAAIVMLAVGLLPWTPFMIRPAWKSIRGRKEDENCPVLFFCSASVIWTALFFAFARQLHPGYLLPALPPATFLMAAGLDELKKFYSVANLRRVVAAIAVATLAVFFFGFSQARSEWAWVGGTVAVGFALGTIYLSKRSSFGIRTLMSFCCANIVAFFGVSLAAASVYLEQENSTLAILTCQARDSEERVADFGVYGDENYSALYYSRAWKEELPREVNLHAISDLTRVDELPDDLLIKRTTLKGLPEALKRDFELITDGGRWTWFHRKTDAIDLSKCGLVKLKDESLRNQLEASNRPRPELLPRASTGKE